MKKLNTSLTVLFVVFLSGLMQAQVSKIGTSPAQFLKIPVGAREAAMGGAVTASVDNPAALYWNPAAITNVTKPSVTIEYADWFVDLSHTFLGLVVPVAKNGAAGLHVNALTMGSFDETTMEFPDGTGRTFNAYSISVGGTYAHRVFDGFSVGGTLKYIQETIWNSSASTVAFDVGTLFTTPFYGIRLGASVSNAGGQMQISGDDLITNTRQIQGSTGEFQPDAFLFTDKFDLPIRLQVGFAFDPIKTEQLRATLTVDGNVPNDNKQSLSIGTELAFLNEMLFLRAGIPDIGLEDRNEEFAAGFGLKYEINDKLGVKFGYAYQSFKTIDETHRLSATISF